MIFSCSENVDVKTFTNNEIKIKTYTIIKPLIQSSSANKSIIEASKGFEHKIIFEYDTYGVNNLNINITNKTIEIEPLDEQTENLIQKSRKNYKDIFGYEIKLKNYFK